MTYEFAKAHLSNMPRLLVSAKQFIEYLDNVDAEWDEGRVSQVLMNLIKTGYFNLIKKDGRIIGALAAVPTPGLWSAKVKHLEEVFWWVDPEHRKGRAGYLLLKSFVTFCKEHGYKPVLHLLSHSNVNPDSLKKLGLVLKEHTFYME